jgi:hypothetical protein
MQIKKAQTSLLTSNLSEAMTFGLNRPIMERQKKDSVTSLPTHSRIVNGNPVETCRPYPAII